jgi:uncharacterized protein (DUF2252 family)
MGRFVPDGGSDLVDSPHLMAVGDLHLENFGTWRDREGRVGQGRTGIVRFPSTIAGKSFTSS